MRYISKKDEDLIQMIHVVSKFPEREAAVLRQLSAHYTANPGDAEGALAYGFFKYITTTRAVLGTDLMRTDILQVLDIYNGALQVEPGYWLVWCFKLLLARDLPPEMVNAEQVRKDFCEIIKVQANAGHQEPYFIMPYIIYADYLFSVQDRSKALEILQQGREAVLARSIKITSVSEYFNRILTQFNNKLMFSQDQELLNIITVLGKLYFSTEKLFNK